MFPTGLVMEWMAYDQNKLGLTARMQNKRLPIKDKDGTKTEEKRYKITKKEKGKMVVKIQKGWAHIYLIRRL